MYIYSRGAREKERARGREREREEEKERKREREREREREWKGQKGDGLERNTDLPKLQPAVQWVESYRCIHSIKRILL